MKVLNWLYGLLFPPRCYVCGKLLPTNKPYLCTSCLSSLPKTYYMSAENPVSDLLKSIPGNVDANAWLRFAHGNDVATLIHDFKYHGFSHLALHLGELCAQYMMTTGIFDGVDLLLPIPLHRGKRLRRGFNQSEKIADGISKITGIPVGNNLVALRRHRTQTSLTSEQRLRNVEGVFGVKRPSELTSMNVLVVDDVFTTGATMLAAADALASSGVNGLHISYLALASAHL